MTEIYILWFYRDVSWFYGSLKSPKESLFENTICILWRHQYTMEGPACLYSIHCICFILCQSLFCNVCTIKLAGNWLLHQLNAYKIHPFVT